MNEQNLPVEQQIPLESVSDDATQAPAGETLESLLSTADASAAEDAPTTDTTPPAKEPGWIRQRIDHAVRRAVADAEARVAERYEARLAPLMGAVMERQAQDLVAAGEFKSIERAREYVRLKGVDTNPAPAAPATQQPRDEQGRFTSTDDAHTRARADILARQAQKIKANSGLDVMQAFNTDDSVRQKVISGEWDFHDVAEHLSVPQRSMPSPIRTPNGAVAQSAAQAIDTMTDEQFDHMIAEIVGGKRFRAQ